MRLIDRADMKTFLPSLLALIWLAAPLAESQAQLRERSFTAPSARLQERANAVLSLMGYSLTPDVTTGSLALTDASAGNPGFSLTTLGGGFTWSKSLPLYLEGTVAYSRYDPSFVASDGEQSRVIPAKWNSVAATGGVGWDFPLSDELKLRPILNFSLGRVMSDASLGLWYLEQKTGLDIDFLKRGHLNAGGLGGSLMLDFEHYRPGYEIDVELRYTNIHLRSLSASNAVVQGQASTEIVSLWSRWRAPLGGLTLLDRPLRYVLEFSHSRYLADEAAVLGVDYLSAIGTGLELDSSKYPIWITRTRLMVRYLFSPFAHGASIGLAVSF